MAKATLIGHVGADPQVHLFNQGSVTTFSVAINNLKGDKQPVTEWYRVCVYNEYLQELARRFITKGSRVYMEGTLRNRQWKDNSGNDKNTVEIHLKYSADLIILSRAELDHTSNGNGRLEGHQGRQSLTSNESTQNLQSRTDSSASEQDELDTHKRYSSE